MLLKCSFFVVKLLCFTNPIVLIDTNAIVQTSVQLLQPPSSQNMHRNLLTW